MMTDNCKRSKDEKIELIIKAFETSPHLMLLDFCKEMWGDSTNASLEYTLIIEAMTYESLIVLSNEDEVSYRLTAIGKDILES